MFESLYPTPPRTPPNGTTCVGTETVPTPPALPVLGHVRLIDGTSPIQSIAGMAEQYGDIFLLDLVGKKTFVVSSNALINEVCDERRFCKNVNSVLTQVRHAVHDGLFTAFGEEEANWGKAHRVLTPAFGPLPIRGMFDDMHDIASQLTLKWARMGAREPINVTDDFTRLALDTLALCSMDYRFNSFYSAQMHPFVEAMGDFLVESGTRSRRALPDYWYRKVDEKYFADIQTMHDVARGVLQRRREQNPPSTRKDLLQAMLEGVDPKTGTKLDDDCITDNLITFLIAGHETTSGLLSFAFHNLIKYPETMRAARAEVDAVCGTGPITAEQLPKLKYVAAVLRETARVNSPIPTFSLKPREDTTLAGGRFFVPKGHNITCMLMRAHLDPTVFGDDAREFKPERMLDANFERLQREHPNCWKPFGNGSRACIGRPFAWQEALLVTAMLLQSFDFSFDDPDYQLRLKETLTIKPDGFQMRAQLRDGLTATTLERRLAGSGDAREKNAGGATAGLDADAVSRLQPMSIYYGSNSGTCETMAQRVAADAPQHGFRADTVAPLDAATDALPTDRPVVIITASYEGQPPDNAGRFVAWVDKETTTTTAQYAVFACGHRDWTATYHRIPTLVDAQLARCGGTRLAPMGGADASDGNMFEDFETWEDSVLWPALVQQYAADGATAGPTAGLHVEVATPRASALRQDVAEAVVVAAHELNPDASSPDGRGRKRHLELQLPPGTTYTAGDYLAVLPFNAPAAVARALRRFGLPRDATITIRAPDADPRANATSSTQTSLPVNTPLAASDALAAYVELAQPVTKRNVLALADAAAGADRDALLRLADTGFADLAAQRVSLLDLLERFPAVDLSLGAFLALLPPMRVRQYSIASSPLADDARATLAYAVLTAPSLAGDGMYHGVASHYLAALQPGDRVHVAVRPSHAAFHPPQDADAATTPIVCIAAGTGLAPFRGFVQERAVRHATGQKLAPAMLFCGARNAADDLYRADLDRWQADGVVDVRRAYSRATSDAESAESAACRHAQDRLYHDRAAVRALWDQGARIYVCGSRALGDGVKQTLVKMHQEWVLQDTGVAESDADADAWFASLRNVRYAADVFD